MKAIVFERAGEAGEVLRQEEVPDPRPLAGQILVRVEARAVNPSDLSFIRGAYRIRPVFPQVAGLSGVGRVVGSGAGVDLPPGARVAFRSPGSWAELVVVPVERTFVVPEDIAVDAAAQFALNPITAWGLLDAANVEAGAWIGLTAPGSSVSRLAIALAGRRGLRTVEVPRPIEGQRPLAERVHAATEGAGLAALIDSVGGPMVAELLPTLCQGATIVTYGALSNEPAPVRNATLVYSNLTWKGFGIDRWLAGVAPDARDRMVAALWEGVREGWLALPVRARVPLASFAEALTPSAGGNSHGDADHGRRSGKVLLVGTA